MQGINICVKLWESHLMDFKTKVYTVNSYTTEKGINIGAEINIHAKFHFICSKWILDGINPKVQCAILCSHKLIKMTGLHNYRYQSTLINKESAIYRRIIHFKIWNYFFLQQDIVLTLVFANNGSIGSNRNFVLSIQPNDNPHGTVEFSASQYNVTEQNTNSVQYLTITRR